MVKQFFEVQVYDSFVMRGNTAIFKAQIPSFVSDHVDIIEWISTDNDTYRFGDTYGDCTIIILIIPNTKIQQFFYVTVYKIHPPVAIKFPSQTLVALTMIANS